MKTRRVTGYLQQAGAQALTSSQQATLQQRTLRTLQQRSRWHFGAQAGAQALTSSQAFGATQAGAQAFTCSQQATGAQAFGRQQRTLRTLQQRSRWQRSRTHFGAQTASQHFGATQAAGAQAFTCSQQAGAQQPLPNKPAWALVLTTAKAATANADNKVRRNMGLTPLLGKTEWDTYTNWRTYVF